MAEGIKSRNGLELRHRVVALAAVAAALTATACGRSVSGESVSATDASSASTTTSSMPPASTTTEQTPASTTPPTSVESSTQATLSNDGAYFTFDDLGGGSTVIQVYAGPGESQADKQPVGTYYDGDTVPVDCIEVDGRDVSSDPTVGEQKKTSDIWFGAHNPVTNQEFYASYVYGAPSVVPDSLPDC